MRLQKVFYPSGPSLLNRSGGRSKNLRTVIPGLYMKKIWILILNCPLNLSPPALYNKEQVILEKTIL